MWLSSGQGVSTEYLVFDSVLPSSAGDFFAAVKLMELTRFEEMGIRTPRHLGVRSE